MTLGKKFILHDLDETHLFIIGEFIPRIQSEIDKLLDQNSFPLGQASWVISWIMLQGQLRTGHDNGSHTKMYKLLFFQLWVFSTTNKEHNVMV